MPRLALAVLAATAALAVALVPGASARSSAPRASRAATADHIALRARFHKGKWQKSLSLKLVKLRLTNFSLCAIYDNPQGSAFDCNAASSRALPPGTIMRLEQSPIAKAIKRPDSPGWGMVGASEGSSVGAVISNLVTGNTRGTYRYRVTLRDAQNKVLLTSNVLKLTWR